MNSEINELIVDNEHSENNESNERSECSEHSENNERTESHEHSESSDSNGCNKIILFFNEKYPKGIKTLLKNDPSIIEKYFSLINKIKDDDDIVSPVVLKFVNETKSMSIKMVRDEAVNFFKYMWEKYTRDFYLLYKSHPTLRNIKQEAIFDIQKGRFFSSHVTKVLMKLFECENHANVAFRCLTFYQGYPQFALFLKGLSDFEKNPKAHKNFLGKDNEDDNDEDNNDEKDEDKDKDKDEKDDIEEEDEKMMLSLEDRDSSTSSSPSSDDEENEDENDDNENGNDNDEDDREKEEENDDDDNDEEVEEVESDEELKNVSFTMLDFDKL